MSLERPATVLERAIARAQQGSIAPVTLLWTLAAGDVTLLNTGQVKQGALPDDPFTLSTESATFLALFTHESMATPFLEGRRVCVRTASFTLLSRLPDGVGIIVNPGSKRGFEVPAEGVAAFVADLLSATFDGQ